MSFNDLIYILKQILVSPYVIGITIAIILYLNLVFFIVNYNQNSGQKIRVKRTEKKKTPPPSPPKEDEPADDEE